MILTGLVLAGLAALLHVFVFYLESLAWTTRARAVIGTTAQEAAATKEMAFNQGFYNLFLAGGTRHRRVRGRPACSRAHVRPHRRRFDGGSAWSTCSRARTRLAQHSSRALSPH